MRLSSFQKTVIAMATHDRTGLAYEFAGNPPEHRDTSFDPTNACCGAGCRWLTLGNSRSRA